MTQEKDQFSQDNETEPQTLFKHFYIINIFIIK